MTTFGSDKYMILLRSYRVGLLHRGPSFILSKYLCTIDTTKENLCRILKISDSKAEYICLKHPAIKKINIERMEILIKTLKELGFSSKVLIRTPSLFSILPITLKYRYKVLEECGIDAISPEHILSYLEIMKQKTIGDLKSSQCIKPFINIENKLASYMTQWPTSLTTTIYSDINEMTLYSLRLKIIQRYLELVLDLINEEFFRAIETYPTIKHRPLAVINGTLNNLQSVLMIPNHKIKSNMYLISADSDNLNHIIYKLCTIGGIDVKEVIRLRPKIAMKSYASLVETKKILDEYDISNEAQVRCFDIYTLGPDTVKERLEQAKEIPEFNIFYKHPRFLKMIHYKNTAMKRLRNLYSNNKKCLSLNILSGSSAHYETFEKAPGDRLGKGKDLVFCISQCFRKTFSANEIRKIIKRHPYWINIPLLQVKYVYQQLSAEYTDREIYENCAILLYPWSKIKDTLNLLNANLKTDNNLHSSLDVNRLDKSQKLSLILYILEKKHYFTGNGVWSEERNKVLNDISQKNLKA